MMDRSLKKLLNKFKRKWLHCKDLHIIRFFSSYVLICNGKAVEVTDPYMTYCPLASVLYKGLKSSKSIDDLKQSILDLVNEKIIKFGHFTIKRKLSKNRIAIPYGASEMLMYALRKKVIDSACVVCDGAGTVIVKKPDLVQAIGARMNSIFYTSAIVKIIKKLERSSSHVLSKRADIDQTKGVMKAVSLGYKKIAVTVNASMDESLRNLREIEKKFAISLSILVICTTGISKKRTEEISRYADMVWSCASNEIRTIVGKKAILQLSRKIPVFILSQKGLDILKAYSSNNNLMTDFNMRNQYLFAGNNNGIKIKMGNFNIFLSETKLPVRHEREPQ